MRKVKAKVAALNKEEVEQVRDVFLEFDTDGDGKLTLSELKDFLREINNHVDSAELAFAIFDNDKSGYIDFQEFVEFATYEKSWYDDPRQYFLRAFEAFDTDKSGKLDAAELANYFRITGVECPELLARKAIAYGNGALTFDQLVSLLGPLDEKITIVPTH
jgi:Ca2+-binding EF-hand superfamily protein